MKSIRLSNLYGQHSRLTLETLENRLLLAALIVNGTDADGDTYQIKLTGPGNFTSTDLDNLVTNLTGSNTTLTIALTGKGPQGDGLINVGSLDTSDLNIGRIVIPGDLGAISIEKVNSLQVDSLGAKEGTSKNYQFGQDVGTITVNKGVSDAVIQIAGKLDTLKVGQKDNPAANLSNTDLTVGGDVKNLQILQSVTAGSTITVGGNLKNLAVAKSIINSDLTVNASILKAAVTGSIIQNCDIQVNGDINALTVGKNVASATFDVNGAIKNLTVKNDCSDSVFDLDSIDRITVGDDFNNNRFNIAGNLNNLTAGDVNGLILRLGGSINTLQINRDLQNALISVLNNINTINIKQDLARTTIMAGVDIGPDLTLGTADDGEWGDLEINAVNIGGDMVDSSIAAGVKPSANNADPYFGNGNDTRAYNDGTGVAHIKKITVRGEIFTTFNTGESYAISAEDGIDSIRAAGKEFTGAPGVVVQEF